MYFGSFDICEAYYALEYDFNVGGMVHERPSNQRRNESIGVQLDRLRFRPRPSLDSYSSLTQNGRSIYRAAVERWGLLPLHIDGVIRECRELDGRE